MKKQKIFLITLLCFVVLSFGLVVHADAMGDLQTNIKNGFKIILGLAGVMAAVSFAVGGVQYMMFHTGEGKDRMIWSVVGMVMLFAFWIVVQNINPTLTNLSLTPMSPGPGIVYVNKDGGMTPAPTQEPDTTSVFNQGYTKIKITCGGLDKTKMAKVLIWEYADPNYKDTTGNSVPTIVDRLSCGETSDISAVGSFKIAVETPGVYFYTKANCGGNDAKGGSSGKWADGDVSQGYTSSQDNLPAPFAGNIASALIVLQSGGPGTSSGYIFFLHQNSLLSAGGGLTDNAPRSSWISGEDMGTYLYKCLVNIKRPGSYNSVEIYGTSADTTTNKLTMNSGDTVRFFSEPNGSADFANAGQIEITKTKYDAGWQKTDGRMSPSDQTNMKLDYAGTSASPEDQKKYKTFYDRHGSIKINGNYLVILCSKKEDESGDTWCGSTTKDVDNLSTTNIFPTNLIDGSQVDPNASQANNDPNSYDFSDVFIIPIK